MTFAVVRSNGRCPPGTDPSTIQPCGGDGTFCVEGSKQPQPVTPGYQRLAAQHAYSCPRTFNFQKEEYLMTNWVQNARVVLCSSGGDALHRTGETPCVEGFYCVEESPNPVHQATGRVRMQHNANYASRAITELGRSVSHVNLTCTSVHYFVSCT
jgi:23S rRNA G2445 N2-methylase RlmL